MKLSNRERDPFRVLSVENPARRRGGGLALANFPFFTMDAVTTAFNGFLWQRIFDCLVVKVIPLPIGKAQEVGEVTDHVAREITKELKDPVALYFGHLWNLN